jgi:hypothetical protein
MFPFGKVQFWIHCFAMDEKMKQVNLFSPTMECDLVLICVDMTSEMSIAKGNASLSYLLLATYNLCHQGCTHFFNF